MLRILFLIGLSSSAIANPYPQGDAKIGEQLFTQHQCSRCHSDITGGDGSAIFTRKNRKIQTQQGLIEHIRGCGKNAGIKLTAQEEQHLGAYLNQYYQMK